jgi:hypothetical protein
MAWGGASGDIMQRQNFRETKFRVKGSVKIGMDCDQFG